MAAKQKNVHEAFQKACIDSFEEIPQATTAGTRWLDTFRRSGQDRFRQLQLPTKKTETWKYTPIFPITKGDFVRLPAMDESTASTIKPPAIPGLDSQRLVFINGRFNESNSELKRQDAVTAIPFSQAGPEDQQLITQYLSAGVDEDRHPFATLNRSWLQDGILIRVHADQKAALPIELVFQSLGQEQSFSIQSRVLVIVEQGAKATLVEHHQGNRGTEMLSNTIAEIFVNDNAHLTHLTLNAEPENVLHIGGIHVKQQAGSHYENHTLSRGSNLKRRDVEVKVLGENAFTRLLGTYLVRGKEHIDHHITVDHMVPHCDSEEIYKGIVADEGKAVFNGRIHIHRDAQQISADMTNNNLLLSNEAEVDSKPELEIYADDVKCSHGTTIGQLNPDSLFYLRSRGISQEDAHLILSHAFIDTVLEQIPNEAVRDHAIAEAHRFHEKTAQHAEVTTA